MIKRILLRSDNIKANPPPPPLEKKAPPIGSLILKTE